MRKRSSYIKKYGLVDGAKLYKALQREAQAAAVVARIKKRLGIRP